MTGRTRSGLICLCSMAVLAAATPVAAFWSGSGAGTGSAAVATMPAGNQPSGTVASQSVTLSWTQSSFLGSLLGTFVAGGYTVARYAVGSSTAITPNASCATTISGAGATLNCVEAGVPYGAWQYTVTPVLDSFVGVESAKSATLMVVTAAPALSTVTAQNPGSAQATGDIQVDWAAASGATGYNIYRRTAAGSYDFGSPLNGATPISSGTTYTDPGSGVSSATTYHYVIRAVAGSPVVESASSNEMSAATISRPAAPSGSVAATAAAAARIDVGWSSVSGVVGYNVYRRTSAGSYSFASPLNGGTPLAAIAYADMGAQNAVTYFYTVKSVVLGAGGAQVESVSSGESASVTADSTPPGAPSQVSVASTNVLASGLCSVASGTRYVNAAGQASVQVTATIATPAAGDTVVFTATAGATITSTVAAITTSVTTTLDLTTLNQGALTVTAATKDAAGNLSTPTAATNIVKDTIAPAMPTATYNLGVFSLGILIIPYSISGASACGDFIRATETTGPNVGKLFPVAGPHQITSGTAYSFDVDGALLVTYRYDVRATDLAGNVGPARNVGN